MKKFAVLLSALAIATMLLFGPNANISPVHAQTTCTDATGATIPCPPTEEPSTGGGGSEEEENEDNSNNGGSQNPSSSVNTPVPTSTSTPMPLVAPTEDGSTGKAEWSGTCKGPNTSETATCIAQFTNGCETVGGSVTVGEIKDGEVPLTCKVPAVLPATPRPLSSNDNGFLGSCTNENLADCREQFKCENGLLVIEVDLYADGGAKYDFYCISHEEFPTLDLPLILAPQEGSTEDTNWGGSCSEGENLSLDACVDLFAAMCDADGGDLSVWYDNDDGTAGVYCENSTPADSQPAPTEAPAIAAAPEDDGSTEGSWDEECGYWTCWMSALACYAEGGSGYELDHASGAHIYHCDTKSTTGNTFPPGGWLPWGVGIVIIALLLPAIQKFANKPKDPQQAVDVLLDIVTTRGESKGKMPNNKNPELVKNKDNEPKAPFIRLGDIDGQAHPHDDTPNETQSDGKKKKIR